MSPTCAPSGSLPLRYRRQLERDETQIFGELSLLTGSRGAYYEQVTVVTLSGAAYAKLLARLANANVAGGRTYDAVIGECARQSKAEALLTFNRRHFEAAPAGVSVIEPAQAE